MEIRWPFLIRLPPEAVVVSTDDSLSVTRDFSFPAVSVATEFSRLVAMPTIREWVTGARGRATRKRRHANAERREQRDQH